MVLSIISFNKVKKNDIIKYLKKYINVTSSSNEDIHCPWLEEFSGHYTIISYLDIVS